MQRVGCIIGLAIFAGGLGITYNVAGIRGAVGWLVLWVWIGKKLDPLVWGSKVQ